MRDTNDVLLLIDGDLARGARLVAALTASGHRRVEWRKRLSEGLQRLEEPDVAAVVLNLFLPDSRGIETFDRTQAVAGRVPILVLCDRGHDALGTMAVARGADDFLPSEHGDPPSVARAVANVLQRSARGAALFVAKRRAEVALGLVGEAVLTTDARWNVVDVNAAAESMTGWPRAEATGRSLAETFNVVDAATRQPTLEALTAAIHQNVTATLPSGGILIARDGHESVIDGSAAPIHDAGGRFSGAVLVFRDSSAPPTTARQLAHLAQHDVLTGLPNRGLVNDRLQQAIALARRHHRRVAVVFLDLDHFKQVNDSLGHVGGDQLLQAVATRLKESVRRSDTVGRLGGDEFVVILSELDTVAHAETGVAKLLAALSQPYALGPHSLRAGSSIGVSLYPDDGEDADVLLNNADMAMYHAKAGGGRRYQFFRRDMTMQAVERQFIEAALPLALERHEFSLHYQPMIDLRRTGMVGAEALLRWRHPERGFIPPTQFVSIAESIGLMVPIGQWVVREACAQARAWQDAKLSIVPIAVNVSAGEFRSKGFVARIRATLEDCRLDPRWLDLEFTESLLMQDTEATVVMLKLLKNIGVRLTVDDCGTGYSSVNYLKQFPIDALKVDQSCIQEISSASADAGIVGAVINMGKSLNKRVIAEGVESRVQLDFLAARGCDEAQGYYFNRPMTANQFAALLKPAAPAVLG